MNRFDVVGTRLVWIVGSTVLTSSVFGQTCPLFPNPIVQSGSEPHSLAIGDVNGDGKLDLAVANYISSNVAILLGNGAGGFAAPTNFAAGWGPFSVAMGELTGDGKLDLVVANYGRNDVSILVGNGAGGFSAPTNFVVGSKPTFLALGDLNSDGKLDLAVANSNSSNVSVLLGDGAGGFSAATNYLTGSKPVAVAIGDLNGDGKPDLAVANLASVSVLLGDGAGGFNGLTNVAVSDNRDIAIGDLNGDGKLDFALVSLGMVSVLLGDGAGGFSAPTVFTAGTNPDDVTIGDLNGDGKLDLAVANYGSDSNPGNVSILLGNGAGGFSAPMHFAVGSQPTFVEISDVNGDGKPDLAVANGTADAISILLGDEAGGFAPAQFATPSQPSSVAIGDLNGDGKPDLAVANPGVSGTSGTMSILLGDGEGGFTAPTNFNAGSFPHSVAIADLNGDGKPDLAVSNYDDFNAGKVSILVGDGVGGFAAPTSFAAGLHSISVAISDLNHDGNPDLTVANGASNDVSVLLGNGAGGFTGPTHFAAGQSPNSVAISDVNGDGKPDLAVANAASGDVSILLGNGTGGFSGPTNFAANSNPRSVTIGDLNGDGKPDLAVANASNSVSILPGDGLGGFSGPINHVVPTPPFSVAIGDLNGDGNPDLAVANYDFFKAGRVSILLGDGAGGFSGFASFAAGWNPSFVAIGDLNGDATLDLAITVKLGVSILLNHCPAAGCGLTPQVANYGTGKPGALGVPQLLSESPKLGFTADLTIVNAVSGPGVLFAGLQPAAIAFDGGTLLVNPFTTLSFVVPPSGGATIPIPIPVHAVLCGFNVYFQAFSVDAAARGPYHTAQTAGMHWVIGA